MRSTTPSAAQRVRVALVLCAAAAFSFSLALVFAPQGMGPLCSVVCHQMPDRTLSLGAQPMAVCSRCSGLYFGAASALALAAAIGRPFRPHRRWFFAATVPTAVDAVLPWFGLPQLTIVPRHVLAWPAGIAIGWFFAVAVADLAAGRTRLRWSSTLEVGDG